MAKDIPNSVLGGWAFAAERYPEFGVDTEHALERLCGHPDLAALLAGRRRRRLRERGRGDRRRPGSRPGNYPGKARTADELRADLEKAFPSSPAGTASTCTPSMPRPAAGRSSANELGPEHFAGWIDWAERQRTRHRLQPHVLLPPEGGRRLHARPSRRGRSPLLDRSRHRLPQDRRGDRPALGSPCVTNVWIPDGFKAARGSQDAAHVD